MGKYSKRQQTKLRPSSILHSGDPVANHGRILMARDTICIFKCRIRMSPEMTCRFILRAASKFVCFPSNRSAGETLTLEIYRKSGQKPSGGGSVTSDQLTAAELHSGSIQQRQLKSPVNQSHISGSVSMAATGRMPVLVSHHQQPSTVAAATSVGIGASGRRVVVENAGQVSWYPSMNSASNTTAQLGINISNAAPPPLKVAFNKSIGGGVLV